MKRWWSVFVVVFTTILVFSSCTRPSTPALTPTEKEVAETGPTLAIPIRGVVLSSGLDAELVRQLKDMGVNWIEMILWVAVTQEGELIPCKGGVPGPPKSPPYSQEEVVRLKSKVAQTEEMMIQRIRQAHDSGFNVFLVTYHERMGAHDDYGAGLKVNVDSFLIQAKEIALRWARICEENEVEMFAPRKELQSFVGQAKALEWDDDILPELRKVYHGSLVRGSFQLYHWSREGKFVVPAEQLPHDIDMSGWDYLGVDLYGNHIDTFEGWAAYVERFASKVHELEVMYGLKGTVFEEIGYPHTGEETFWQDSSLSGNEILERLYEITFEACSEAIEGFFDWGYWRGGITQLYPGREEHVSLANLLTHYYTATVIPKSYENVTPAEEMVIPEVTVGRTKIILEEDFENTAMPQLVLRNCAITDGILRLKDGSLSISTNVLSVEDVIFGGRLQVLEGSLGVVFRDSHDANYIVSIQPLPRVHLIKGTQDGETWRSEVIRSVDTLIEFEKWYDFTIVAKDGVIQFFLDGKGVLDYIDSSPLPGGAIAIHVNGEVLVDDLLVEEILE